MATDEAEFGTELRGYRKEEVDKALGELRRELIKANNDRADAAEQSRQLGQRISDLEAELDEVGAPSYRGLGAKLESTLRVAEEQSSTLIAKTEKDAAELRSSSSAEAQRILDEAGERAADMLDDAR